MDNADHLNNNQPESDLDQIIEGAETETNLINDIQTALAQAKEEISAYKDKHLRTLADLDNLRRRTIIEKDQLRKTAASQLIESILPVLDSFQLGLQAAQQHPEAQDITKGFRLAFDQLMNVLQQQGLTILNPIDAAFDPHQHECIAQRQQAGVDEGTVLEVVRVGYQLADKLLRPASVIVAS